MCLGGKVKAPKQSIAQAAPTRDEAAAVATNERRRIRDQQGVYGNIFTSVLGDPTYGSNVQRQAGVASIGA